jgi:hypothetical protein
MALESGANQSVVRATTEKYRTAISRFNRAATKMGGEDATLYSDLPNTDDPNELKMFLGMNKEVKAKNDNFFTRLFNRGTQDNSPTSPVAQKVKTPAPGIASNTQGVDQTETAAAKDADTYFDTLVKSGVNRTEALKKTKSKYPQRFKK